MARSFLRVNHQALLNSVIYPFPMMSYNYLNLLKMTAKISKTKTVMMAIVIIRFVAILRTDILVSILRLDV